MKKILIISPNFPPVNGADMHRVRHLLPALGSRGWRAEVIVVHPDDIEAAVIDPLLLRSIPTDVTIHTIRAFKPNWTRKIGIGSLSMRSFFQFRKKGNELLSKGNFHLVYFSTTSFHLMALGPYWKKKFKVPYVLDMQDPWRNDFYLSVSAEKRPPKFWINYQLDKLLERRSVPAAAAVISVSPEYLRVFNERYDMADVLERVIPFGIHSEDMEVARSVVSPIQIDPSRYNIVYVGRGGKDMETAAHIFFSALRATAHENLKQIKCWFVGTDYAPASLATKTFEPIARTYYPEIEVQEITDRIPYYEGLALLLKADGLIIPGSDDIGYVPSKIFPYLLAQKPLIAIMQKGSPANTLFENYTQHPVIYFSNAEWDQALGLEMMKRFMLQVLKRATVTLPDTGLQDYIRSLVDDQVDLFNTIASAKHGI